MEWVDGHFWYEAEPAKTGRSTCKEFRCKQKIEQGELRIGLMQDDETDHFGSNLGWWHPECLWKTFTYSKNANKRITSVKEIRGFNSLDDDQKKVIADLVTGKKTATTRKTERTGGDETAPATTSATGKLLVAFDDSGVSSMITVSGPTFDLKAELKAQGGTWDGKEKRWCYVDDEAQSKILKFLGIAKAPKDLPSKATAASTLQGDTSDEPKAKRSRKK